MPWGVIQGKGIVTQTDFVAVLGYDVATWCRDVEQRRVGFCQGDLPVLLGHNYFRAVVFLKVCRATRVIEMAVGINQVFYVSRVKSQLADIALQHVNPLAVQGVDQHQTVAGINKIGRYPVDADIVDIVKNLKRLLLTLLLERL